MQPNQYSQAFKQQVVQAVQRGEFPSLAQASRHYGIRGKSTLTDWLKAFGTPRPLPPAPTPATAPWMANESTETQKLKQRIRELEKLVAEQALKVHYQECLLEVIAEENGCTVQELNQKKDIKL